MDPMTISLALAAAGGAAAAAGSAMEGRERSRAAAFESQQLAREEQETRTAAAQAEARRREELTSSLETIQAIRTGRNVGSASPTGLAILDQTIQDESRDIRTERFNYLSRAEQARLSSRMARRKSKSLLTAGYVGAAADLATTGSKIAGART
jgi:hypothetical protein